MLSSRHALAQTNVLEYLVMAMEMRRIVMVRDLAAFEGWKYSFLRREEP